IEAGGLFPTKYGVFGGSLRFIQSPFNNAFPVKTTFGGNLNAAKELLPGMLLGAGFNFGFGNEWTLAGDLGFRYNLGKFADFENVTFAVALRGMGKSWTPTWFTPIGGFSLDIFHSHAEGKSDPIIVNLAADIGVPSIIDFSQISLIAKAGASLTFAERFTVSASWPGASGLNIRELAEGHWNPSLFIPSVGLGLNITLNPSGKRIAGGRLPSDGNITVNAAARPLYQDIWAFGGGVSWAAGVPDRFAPVIKVDYPEIVYISPNNDGKSDELEFPVTITDQRYIASWTMEIKNENDELVRTYRNKERRPETQGVRNIISLLMDVKSGVEVPPTLRWDGIFDSGEIAPDGTYTFVITAVDDNDNRAATDPYTVVVDNTPPEIAIEAFMESLRIFSPDGDGSKDTFTIYQSGSAEDLWDAGIYDAAGQKIRSFNITEGSPDELEWDGKDDEGAIVGDGVYTYRISAVDRAQNSGNASLENIIISTIQPTVSLFIADAWFSPNGDGIKDTVSLNPATPVKEGIVSWSLQIEDSQGGLRRTISGGSVVPETLEFDGKNDQGAVLGEGLYHGNLSVRYRNGYVSTAASPSFTLDVTPPTATVQIEYPAFSPNNDGSQDEMIIRQSGSNEILWVGEIRRADLPTRPIRSYRFQGTPTAQITWDGHGDTGAFAADGDYTYELYATDPAGNTGRSNPVLFSLSTADTPVMLTTDLRAFSPNNNGVKDTITLNPQIQVREGIAGWKVDVTNSDGVPVRTFEGTTTVPAAISWNGRDAAGAIAPDGNYTARIDLRYVQGNQPGAVSTPFTLDTAAPKANIATPYTLFSPNGDSARDSLPLQVSTEGDDEWNASITNAQGEAIRSWNWQGSLPVQGAAPALNWDGKDEAGNAVPDGTYQFTLDSTDEAGNSTRLQVANIVLDARVPRLILTTQVPAIVPKPGQSEALTQFGVIVTPQDGIENWKLELIDANGAAVRSFTSPQNAGPQNAGQPPASIGWNGLMENGGIREGLYTPVLTVTYTKGDVASAQATPVLVDVSGPVLSFSSRPEYFSPDNDGVDDELIMSLGAKDVSPIATWSLEIREPQPPRQLFYRIEGKGSPAERITWNGLSNRGELVQAATDYPYTFRAADTLGNTSQTEGIIGVDVLVIRDGDRLRIQVPSIIFRENADDFNSLAVETQANNVRVLRRIAEILNKFRDYRITVEGHANPTTAPNTAARRAEETGTAREIGLQPLSEARARAVVTMLVEFGVNRGRLSSVGRGGNQPVVKFEDHDNWWKNRRVEFILIK
ncbi:MAG: gliding motility-associated C-terminal domain-containing protein, partial [Treponema sp.]|nr:gliding motility-associated C-terminal domain-containing protein [Treponema sp.]